MMGLPEVQHNGTSATLVSSAALKWKAIKEASRPTDDELVPGLLRLPTEIRDQVFEYIFESERIEDWTVCLEHRGSTSQSTLYLTTPEAVSTERLRSEHGHLRSVRGIFFVSRPVRRACLSWFLRGRVVCINAETKHFQWFVRTFGRDALQYITRLHLSYYCAPAFTNQFFVYECLREIKELDELYLDVPDFIAANHEDFISLGYSFTYWDARITFFTFLRGLERLSKGIVTLQGDIGQVPEITKLLLSKGGPDCETCVEVCKT